MREFRILTICGSMRFYADMLRIAAEYTEAGHIILMPFVVKSEQSKKIALDVLHFRKIDISDGIVVVTDEGLYIGESTQREIAYAKSHCKDIITVTIP